MLNQIPLTDMVSGTINLTDDTSTDVIATQGTSVRIAVLGVMVTNASESVATKVKILDGSTNKVEGYAGVKGGWALNGNGYPLFYATANTAVKAQCVTTGADVNVFVWACKVPAK